MLSCALRVWGMSAEAAVVDIACDVSLAWRKRDLERWIREASDPCFGGLSPLSFEPLFHQKFGCAMRGR